jgi:hypothetical protein
VGTPFFKAGKELRATALSLERGREVKENVGEIDG